MSVFTSEDHEPVTTYAVVHLRTPGSPHPRLELGMQRMRCFGTVMEVRHQNQVDALRESALPSALRNAIQAHEFIRVAIVYGSQHLSKHSEDACGTGAVYGRTVALLERRSRRG